MKDRLTIIDDLGKKVAIDIERFIDYNNKFHSSDASVHKGRGHYFTVDDSFRKML